MNAIDRESHDRETYIERLYPADADLAAVKRAIRENGMHDISVSFAYGRLLTLLVKMSGAKRVLEIGALGGYSGICLARGLGEDGTLTSLELNPAYAEVARAMLVNAGFGERATYLTGEALAHMKRLHAEGQTFDFFFIDADKGNYLNYLEMAIALSVPGAVIVADNTFLGDRILDPKRNGESVRTMRAFNERLATDPRLDSTLLPAYDGLAIARVKG